MLGQCYLGYYRFSVDFDFTFQLREKLSRSERRKLISSEVRWLSEKLGRIGEELGLDFRPFEGKKPTIGTSFTLRETRTKR